MTCGIKLAEHGIDRAGKTARRLTRSDCGEYGLMFGTDRANIPAIHRICGGDVRGRTRLLKLQKQIRESGK